MQNVRNKPLKHSQSITRALWGELNAEMPSLSTHFSIRNNLNHLRRGFSADKQLSDWGPLVCTDCRWQSGWKYSSRHHKHYSLSLTPVMALHGNRALNERNTRRWICNLRRSSSLCSSSLSVPSLMSHCLFVFVSILNCLKLQMMLAIKGVDTV